MKTPFSSFSITLFLALLSSILMLLAPIPLLAEGSILDDLITHNQNNEPYDTKASATSDQPSLKTDWTFDTVSDFYSSLNTQDTSATYRYLTKDEAAEISQEEGINMPLWYQSDDGTLMLINDSWNGQGILFLHRIPQESPASSRDQGNQGDQSSNNENSSDNSSGVNTPPSSNTTQPVSSCFTLKNVAIGVAVLIGLALLAYAGWPAYCAWYSGETLDGTWALIAGRTERAASGASGASSVAGEEGYVSVAQTSVAASQ